MGAGGHTARRRVDYVAAGAARPMRQNGRTMALITTIDAAGRVVIPKALRDRLGLAPGRPVVISERDGRVEIEPVTAPLDLVNGKGGPVAVPRDELPSLTDDIVKATIDGTRR